MKLFTTTITEKKMITSDTLELVIKKPGGFKFKSGQFIQFAIPDQTGKIFRSYSIASHPKNFKLVFCIKLLPDGKGSNYFRKLDIGKEIEISEANGRFVCADNNIPLLFVATGAGLAPIFSILSDQLENKKSTQSIRLLFGLRFAENIFWLDKLTALQDKYPNFNFTVTISRSDDNWHGARGRVINHLVSTPIHGHYYLCGNVDMVKDTRKLLITGGVPDKNIHFEIF